MTKIIRTPVKESMKVKKHAVLAQTVTFALILRRNANFLRPDLESVYSPITHYLGTTTLLSRVRTLLNQGAYAGRGMRRAGRKSKYI
jgi:hypothetical protein